MPSKRISPFSMKYACSTSDSATFTDCSTRTTAVPSALIARTMLEQLTDDGRRQAEGQLVHEQQLRSAASSPCRARASAARRPTASTRAGCAVGEARELPERVVDRCVDLRARTSERVRRTSSGSRRRSSGGNTALPPGICEMPSAVRRSASRYVMSTPCRRTDPRVGSPSPEIARSSVDLPAPFTPSSATISPSSTVKSTPKSTCTCP